MKPGCLTAAKQPELNDNENNGLDRDQESKQDSLTREAYAHKPDSEAWRLQCRHSSGPGLRACTPSVHSSVLTATAPPAPGSP